MSAIQNAITVLDKMDERLSAHGYLDTDGARVEIKEAIQALQSLEGEAEKEAEELIIQRDYWEEKATELAMAVGDHFDVDVGEHSSDNCPVITAIDYMVNHTTPQPPAVPSLKTVEQAISDFRKEYIGQDARALWVHCYNKAAQQGGDDS